MTANEVIFLGALIAIVAALCTWTLTRNGRRRRSAPAPKRAGASMRHAAQEDPDRGVPLMQRVKMPGRNRQPWSAADEDHAWNVGVGHAYAREPFNPPRERAFRAAYLDGYRSTSEDEGIANQYPDE